MTNCQYGKTKLPAVNRHHTPWFERRHERKRRALERLPDGRIGVRVPLGQNDAKQYYSFLRLRAEEKVSANCLIGGRNSIGSDVARRD